MYTMAKAERLMSNWQGRGESARTPELRQTARLQEDEISGYYSLDSKFLICHLFKGNACCERQLGKVVQYLLIVVEASGAA